MDPWSFVFPSSKAALLFLNKASFRNERQLRSEKLGYVCSRITGFKFQPTTMRHSLIHRLVSGLFFNEMFTSKIISKHLKHWRQGIRRHAEISYTLSRGNLAGISAVKVLHRRGFNGHVLVRHVRTQSTHTLFFLGDVAAPPLSTGTATELSGTHRRRKNRPTTSSVLAREEWNM